MRIALGLLFVCSIAEMSGQSMLDLTGTWYEGTIGAEPSPGCEGCGNRGVVHFIPGGMVDYLLPGSDMMDRKPYTRQGEQITLEGGRITMRLKGDSLFLDAYDHRHPYVRVRREKGP